MQVLNKINSFYKRGLTEIIFLVVNILFNKVIALLFIPFIHSRIGTNAYIQYDYYLTFLTIGTSLFILGVDSGIVQFLQKETGQTESEKFTRGLQFGVANILLLSSATLLLYVVVSFFFKKSLFVFADPVFTVCVVANTIVVAFQNFFYALLRWMSKTHIAAVGNILVPVSAIIPSAIYFFSVAVPSLTTFLLVNFSGGLFGALLFLYGLNRKGLLVQNGFLWREYREMFRFSFPLGINSLLFNSVRYSDRFILAGIFGTAALRSALFADYLLIQRIGQFLASVLQLISAAFLPIIFEQAATAEGRTKIRKLQHVLVASHLPVLLLTTSLLVIFQQQFFSTTTLIYYFPFSLISFFALSDMTGVGIGFFKGNKTKEILYISFGYLALNSALQVFVGNRFGMGGVLVSNCVVAILYSLIYTRRSETHFAIGYNLKLVSFLYVLMVTGSLFFLLSGNR